MLTGSCHKTCVIRYPIISLGWQALFMDQWLSCAYCFIGSIESVNVVTNGQQWHQVKSAPGHFGTRLGQFGTSVINNFVIIKYLYIYI